MTGAPTAHTHARTRPPQVEAARGARSFAAWLLLALVVAVPALRGGVDLAVELAAALGCFAVLALARGLTVPRFALLLAVVPLFIAFQLVPLPPAVLRLLSPSALDVFERNLRPLGLFPALRPLSMDPPETARELIKALACLAALLAAHHLQQSRRHRERLFRAIALAGTMHAGAVLLAALAGVAPLLVSSLTFVNENHLAGYLNLTAFPALGVALADRGKRRALWTIAFAVSSVGVFVSLSRGGIGAYFVGALGFAFLHSRELRVNAGDARPVRHLVAPLAIGLAIAAGAFVALDPVIRELNTVRTVASDVKLRTWREALPILRDYPLTGVGRGAFASVFPEYRSDSDAVTFTHVENEWLQAPIDLGIVVGLLLVGALVWQWVSAVRRPGLSRPDIGVAAGLAAVGVQNVVDFSVTTLGVALTFTVLLAALRRRAPAVPVPVWPSRAFIFLGAIACGGAFWISQAHPSDRDAAAVVSAANADEAMRLAREALVWHPADFLPTAAAGVRLAREDRCSEALGFLQRANQRNPTAPAVHRAIARCSSRLGRKAFAMAEYRLAYLLGDRGALEEALARFPERADIARIVPDLPDALRDAAGVLAPTRPAEAAVLLDRAWSEFRSVDALRPLSATLLEMGRADQALTAARALEEEVPARPEGFLAAAAALRALERTDEARAELERGLSRSPGSAAILEGLALDSVQRRHFAEAHRLAEQVEAATPTEVAAKRVFVARILLAAGRSAEALAAAREARDAAPGDPGTLAFLAEVCVSLQRYDESVAALEAASALPGVNPGRFAGRLAELRAARAAQTERRVRVRALDGSGP